MHQDKDIFGKAATAFYYHQDPTEIKVHSPDFEDDLIEVPYLFRDYSEMPPLEKKALNLCFGKVLDVGCSVGSHALYLQETRNLEVFGIDISPGVIEIAKARGLQNALQKDFFSFQTEKFDTILMLMNGSGIIGKLSNLDEFFNRAADLLKPGGKILMDSSDLSYLYDADEDGGIWVNPEDGYYGELQFQISYKGEKSEVFNWLYIDFNSLELAANKNKFSCRLVSKGKHYDYLAELTKN